MGCFGSKNKYPNLQKATLMDKTKGNNPINKALVRQLTTKAEQQNALKIPNTTPEMIKICSEPFSSVDQITPNIYLTGTGGMVKENIVALKITCIINATFEAPNYYIRGLECIRVPVDDTSEDDMSPYLEEVADKLNEVTINKGTAIVHCLVGVSRSTTLVLAYLIKYRKMTLKEAFVYVNKRRVVAEPNPGFFRQLIDFEKKILGKNSVKMIEKEIRGVRVTVPDFYEKEYPKLLMLAVEDSANRNTRRQETIEGLSERSIL